MTWRGNSSYAGGQGNRAGERFMRLRLFDRIRRLAHSRRSPVEAAGASGVQGRHRRSGRRRPAPGGPAPGGPPTELAHIAAPWPGGPPAGQVPLPSGSPAALADLAPQAPRAPAAPVSGSQPPDSRLSAERTGAGPGPPAFGPPASGPPESRSRRGAGSSALRAGGARARIRHAPQETAQPAPAAPAAQARWQETEEPSAAAARADALARRIGALFLAARGLALAVRAALRGGASAGTAADRRRAQELRIARGHLVAAVGPGVAAAPGGGDGRGPAGRAALPDQGKARRRPRRHLHRPGRRPGTRRYDQLARCSAAVRAGHLGCLRRRLRT